MELNGKSVDFDELWSNLHDTTRCLITGRGTFSRDSWNDRILDVYHLCVAQPVPCGNALYCAIKALLDYYVSALCKHFQELPDSELLVSYMNYWPAYRDAAPYLNKLYSYLNIEVAKNTKYNNVNAELGPYSVEFGEHSLEIGDLSFSIWQRELVHELRDRLTSSILYQIYKDRIGMMVNHRAVQGVISSLVDLLQFKPNNYLQLYEDLFEIPFFKTSTAYYISKAQSLRDSGDCGTFLKEVMKLINDESARSFRYLHPLSQQRLIIDCQTWLLCEENVDYLNDSCHILVQREQWQGLSDMYQLLGIHGEDDCYLVLRREFEEHLIDTGLAIMQSLQGDHAPAQFVEAVSEFYSFYRDRVTHVFGANKAFYKAVDKACWLTVNYKSHPKALCKTPELLTRYCDELMQKGAKSLSEAGVEEKLSRVVILFYFLADKDLFQQFYSRKMAKRLIYNLQLSFDIEESMLSKLKQVCGYEYTSKLHRMYTDIVISSDLNIKFLDFINEQPERQLSHTLNISILQTLSWPLSHSTRSLCSLPTELEKTVAMFEMFYNQYYSGRKLAWMYESSRVDLRFGFCQRPYVVTMEMFTMVMLLPFNTSDRLSFQDLAEITQLQRKQLLRQLQTLVNAKILITRDVVGEDSEFHLNLKYSSKRTKFKILPVTRVEVIEESVQTHVAAEEDRRLFIQAAIVRIMKSRKEVQHDQLINEVVQQAKSRFTPRVSAIKKCIEILIDKGYVERSKDSKDIYIYIA